MKRSPSPPAIRAARAHRREQGPHPLRLPGLRLRELEVARPLPRLRRVEQLRGGAPGGRAAGRRRRAGRCAARARASRGPSPTTWSTAPRPTASPPASASSTACWAAASCRAPWCSSAASPASARARCSCRWRTCSAALAVRCSTSPARNRSARSSCAASGSASRAAGCFLMGETSLERILEHVDECKPAALVVDSVQTVYSSKFASAPGSISQVREVATQLLFLAKGRGVTTFLIGHVTKDGSLAGPEVARAHRRHRPLLRGREAAAPPHRARGEEPLRRGLRAGRLRDDGRRAAGRCANPSALFLSERLEGSPGSAVVATIEGSRPMLVEVQALVSPTSFGNPRRMAIGLDANRISLLLAVLEKRVGLELLGDDVFVSVAGGLEVDGAGGRPGRGGGRRVVLPQPAAARGHRGVRRGRPGRRGARRAARPPCASARRRRWASRAASCRRQRLAGRVRRRRARRRADRSRRPSSSSSHSPAQRPERLAYASGAEGVSSGLVIIH